MNRKLILISCDNGGQGYLPGVAIDIDRYNRFFRSSRGGAWRDEEIRMFPNTSRTILHEYILMTENARHVDYWLIVFCGHGRVDINGNTQLLLSQDNEVCELEIYTWVTNSRCLIIGDCCRERRVLQGDQLIQEHLMRGNDDLDSEASRDAYNSYIRQSPAGMHCSAYAVSAGETAGETIRHGGIYSYCLMNACSAFANQNGGIIEPFHPSIISFENVHSSAARNVEMLTHNEQHPISSGNICRLPFVVVAGGPN